MKRARYPHLEDLLGGYFHEDWRQDAPDADAALALYAKAWPPAHRAAVRGEIDAVLRLKDAALHKNLRRMGCAYHPPADGLSARAWLERVRDRLGRAD